MIWHRRYATATNLIRQSHSTSAPVWAEFGSNWLDSLYREGVGGSYSKG
jgi:hypothetical protein